MAMSQKKKKKKWFVGSIDIVMGSLNPLEKIIFISYKQSYDKKLKKFFHF